MEPKALLSFTPEAWLKMKAAVEICPVEIAWHGLVKRKSENLFEVTDILVFPQYVTSTSTETDQHAYEKWFNKLSVGKGDLHLQGHSHVNLEVSSSPEDKIYQQNMIDRTIKTKQDDSFYVFLITNKQGDFFCKIHDFKNEIVYNTEDVKLCVILSNGKSLVKFAKAQISEHLKFQPLPKEIETCSIDKQ